MKKWLQTKYDKLIHKVKLWVYKWCLLVLKKLRIYHTDEIIAKTNSKEGFWWNDRLLLKIRPTNVGGWYTVLYCVPGVSINVTSVDMNDLITGTAELPLYGTKNIEAVIRQLKEHDKNLFPGGVQVIGTMEVPSPTEPTKPLYNSPSEFNRIKEEILAEYQAKLKAEESRKDG